jgi:hypothetical protein
MVMLVWRREKRREGKGNKQERKREGRKRNEPTKERKASKEESKTNSNPGFAIATTKAEEERKGQKK